MKIRMLVLGLVMVVVAAVAVPAVAFAYTTGTGTTTVSGDITDSSITISAPATMAFQTFHVGDNNNGPQSATLTVACGTIYSGWTASVKDSNQGYMSGHMNCPSIAWMTDEMKIVSDGTFNSANSLCLASTGLGWSGSGSNTYYLPLSAQQTVTTGDAVGSYSITLTWEAGLAY